MAGVAAQAVVAVHLAYLLYVLLGGLLGLRSLHWLWPHLVTVFWGIIGFLTQVACPLTLLEKHLLALDGTEPYAGTFIAHYLAGAVYPATWQSLVWWGTAVMVLVSYSAALAHHTAARSTVHR